MLTAIRTAFTKEVPDTQLAFHSSYTINQIELLMRGSLQAGIIVLPIKANGLRIHCIWRESLSLVLPEDHRLTSQEEITFKDLLKEPMIWIAKAINPVLYEHLLKCCQKLGFVPNIVHEVMTVTEALDLVASRFGLTFAKGSTVTRLQPKGVVFRNLAAPGLAMKIGVAYRGDNRSKALQSLVRLLREQSTCGEP